MAKREINKTAKWDGKTYDRKGGFHPNKSTVQELAKEYRAKGFSAVIDKRKAGHFVWVSRTKKAPRKGGSGGGTRKSNIKDKLDKEKGSLAKLSLQYVNLSMPVSKSEASRIRKIKRNYMNKKKLTSTQAKRLKSINKTLEKIKEVRKKNLELTLKIKESKKSVKALKDKVADEKKKKSTKSEAEKKTVNWDKSGRGWANKTVNYGKTKTGYKLKGFINKTVYGDKVHYSVKYSIYSQKHGKWLDHSSRHFKMVGSDDVKAMDIMRYNAPN